MIQIETSDYSRLIIFEKPTKFPGPSGCASCSRFGSFIVLSSQSVSRLIIEQLFHFAFDETRDGSLKGQFDDVFHLLLHLYTTKN